LGKSLLKGSKFLVDKSDGVGNDLAVGITGSTGIHVVLGGLLALFPSVGSLLSDELDSLVDVFECGLGLENLIVD
jgi:hypothetical protein